MNSTHFWGDLVAALTIRSGYIMALHHAFSDAEKDRFRDDLAQLIRRPGPELEDREQASERGEAQERDSWKYRHPMSRRHMRDEDDEDWRERHHMMRQHHKWDDDDEGPRDRQGMWRDRDYRSRYHGYEDTIRHRWRDDCHRSWLDRD